MNNSGAQFDYTEEGNTIQFELKHDWYVRVINLPVGATIEIKEDDGTGYQASYTQGEATTKTDGTTATFILNAKGNTVTFFNDETIQIDTGIRDDVSPYLFLLGLIPLAGVGLFLGQRRRRRMIAG